MKRLSVVGGICASLLLGAAGMAVAQDEHKQDEHKQDEHKQDERKQDTTTSARMIGKRVHRRRIGRSRLGRRNRLGPKIIATMTVAIRNRRVEIGIHKRARTTGRCSSRKSGRTWKNRRNGSKDATSRLGLKGRYRAGRKGTAGISGGSQMLTSMRISDAGTISRRDACRCTAAGRSSPTADLYSRWLSLGR